MIMFYFADFAALNDDELMIRNTCVAYSKVRG